MNNQRKNLISSAKLREIAKIYGTPTYVYSEQILVDKCQKLQNLFPQLPVRWLYAIKANDNPHLLKIIRGQGFGFDTVSYEEVLLASHVETDPHEIFYTENNMTDEEMHAAIEKEVVLNIGSVYRLKQFCLHPGAEKCCLRLNPEIGDGHHKRVVTGNKESKFGIGLDKIDECLKLTDKHNIKISGIHTHIGSGISKPENLISAIKKMLGLAEKFPDLQFINFGGGLPIPYKPADTPFDLEEFGKQARAIFSNDFKNRSSDFHYWFEPGRWIVGDAGTLLAEVTCVKNQGSICYLGTNTGFNHLARPIVYNAYHKVMNISHTSDKSVELYTVSGNICESGDILAKDRSLPITTEGDILAFKDAGAYGMNMASHYNRRSFPAEILIEKSGNYKVIRPRKSFEDTVRDYLNDTRF